MALDLNALKYLFNFPLESTVGWKCFETIMAYLQPSIREGLT